MLVLFQELVVMGAPGSYYWTGTVKVFNVSSNTLYNLNKEDVTSHRYSYLGRNFSEVLFNLVLHR